MTPTRVFIHGWDSSAQGTKGQFFQERYPEMIVEDFSGTFAERMAKLSDLLAGRNDLILVGSSYGGLMASIFACHTEKKIRKLILLAPALNQLSHETRGVGGDFPVIIYHGSHDDVVPPEPIRKIAGKLFRNITYHLVDDDHSLHRNFFTLDWDDLLS